MRHSREEVIERTIREFRLLDRLVARLTDEDWERLLLRPETKDPWTVKDALAHITHWKADVARSARRQPRPSEERGLGITDGNRLIYLRWRHRSPQEVLAWHKMSQSRAAGGHAMAAARDLRGAARHAAYAAGQAAVVAHVAAHELGAAA